MKILLPLTLMAAATPAVAPLAETPIFGPAEGSTVTKTLLATCDLELTGGRMRTGGEEEEDAPEGFSLEARHSAQLTLVDRYAAVADGRPLRLERTYDDVEVTFGAAVVEPDGDEDDADESFESVVEGEGVAWVRDADEERWVAEPLEADSPLDEDLLARLYFDYDGLALLPEHDVAPGATWAIEGEELASLLGAAADLQLEPTGTTASDEMVPAVMCATPSRALDSVVGELEATLVEVVEDGGRFARIELTGTLECNADASATLARYQEAFDERGGGPEELTLDVELELEGILLWDLEARRIASLELGGPVALTLLARGEQGGMDVEIELDFEGRADWILSTE